MSNKQKLHELLDAVDAEHARLWKKFQMHSDRANELRKDLAELESRASALKSAAETHRRLVIARWNLRRSVREVRARIEPIENKGLPARTARIRKMWRTRHIDLKKQLIEHAVELPAGIGESGIYALFDGQEITYIGQAVNVLSRIGTHAREKEFTHVAFISVPKTMLDEVERGLIDAYLPKLNRDPATVARRTALQNA